MKILTSIPFLSILLVISLAGMETTPAYELKGFFFASINLAILTLILFKAIFSKKAANANISEKERNLDKFKGNLVGKAEDGTEYYLIKMKGNTPVKA